MVAKASSKEVEGSLQRVSTSHEGKSDCLTGYEPYGTAINVDVTALRAFFMFLGNRGNGGNRESRFQAEGLGRDANKARQHHVSRFSFA